MEIIADLWRVQDNMIESTPTPVMKFALVLYHGLREMIINDEIAQLLLIGNSMPMVRQAMFDDFSARVGKLVSSDPDVFGGQNTNLAIDSTYGSEIWILERKRSGEIDCEIHEICLFHVRWTLQAICIPQDKIEKTLKDLARYKVGRDDSSQILSAE